MSATESWKPSFNRRQSWSKEEHKHALQMTGIAQEADAGPGYTQKKPVN
jgi:hypothetical protein